MLMRQPTLRYVCTKPPRVLSDPRSSVALSALDVRRGGIVDVGNTKAALLCTMSLTLCAAAGANTSQCSRAQQVRRAASRTGVVGLSEPIVSTAFDAGNVEVNGVTSDAESASFQLGIRRDPFTQGTDETAHSQWFYFRVSGVLGKKSTFLLNTTGCSYEPGYDNFRTVASYDRKNWFRVESTEWQKTKDGSQLNWTITPTADSVFFAYFQPYSYEQHMDLMAEFSNSNNCDYLTFGRTLDGRPLDMLRFGDGPLQLYVVARQHPGESMASWLAEGLIRRLADQADPKAKALMRAATVNVVPNINPDGSIRGHLRTNAGGANLNREWSSGIYPGYDAPTLERSPEVYYILQFLEQNGCDAYIDVHGDEEIEANFIAGSEGVAGYETIAPLYDNFQQALVRASPDFQIGKGYDKDLPGEANLAICSNAVAHKFGCLAVTLEQPFKDTTFNTPEPDVGWNGPRAMKLGAALIDALLDNVDDIRKSKDLEFGVRAKKPA